MPPKSRRGQVVRGYHFVCPRENDVESNRDGTVWTGIWVVAKNNAEKSAKVGAYVALHKARSEPSYLQGKIKESRSVNRNPEHDGRPVKIKTGIKFLLTLTDKPYPWNGNGSGEKGYVWGPCPAGR